MAWKMQLNSPYEGMAFIWNISQHVGVVGECLNQRDDLELVQRLIIERYKVAPSKTRRATGIGWLNIANGVMDTQTAFEILWQGDTAKPLKDALKISPARGGNVDYGGGLWTIAYLNYRLHKSAPQVWANFPDICSPTLRTALLTKFSP